MDILNNIVRGLLGISSMIFICYLLSSNRKQVNWRIVLAGIALQLVIGLLMLKVDFVRSGFEFIVKIFTIMIDSSEESARFMFGDLAKKGSPFGFAFYVLPTIVFFSAISSLMYYLGILQKVVYGFAWLMSKTMRLTGAESLAAAANVFIGQTEAPLVVKPYLSGMSKSEIMCLMTGGMATIAGGVFAAYLSMLGGEDPEALLLFGMHLLTASIISAPAAIVAAKVLIPEERTDINTTLHVPRQEAGSNLLDALATGTTDGIKLAVNVGGMLLAFMAMIYLLNKGFNFIGQIRFCAECNSFNDMIAIWSNGTYTEFSIQYILGFVFAPIAWLIGVPNQDLVAVGQMLGEKTILNEFVAYASLSSLMAKGVLSSKATIIATYALCGFANFASIGIQIGGIGSIAPTQRKVLTSLGFKALIGGTVACLMTGAVAGMIIG